MSCCCRGQEGQDRLGRPAPNNNNYYNRVGSHPCKEEKADGWVCVCVWVQDDISRVSARFGMWNQAGCVPISVFRGQYNYAQKTFDDES